MDDYQQDNLRVLILAPTTKDATATSQILADQCIASQHCTNIQHLCREAVSGAGAAVVAEEFLRADQTSSVTDLLHNQSPWSDLPLIVLMRGGEHSPQAIEAIKGFGHVTLMSRPVQIAVLISTIESALRDRRRQYAVRDLLKQHQQVSAELARDVERRQETEEELRQVAARLSEADRRKDEFLAMLAHELRNPLAALSGALNLLDAPGLTDDQSSDARDVAGRQLGHLQHLIDDLLDISRITRGKVRLRKKIFNLTDAVEQAVEAVQPLIDTHGHELRRSLQKDEESFVYGDSARIQQVIANLLTNAAKYTVDGGQITITSQRDGQDHVVKVQDSGEGISPEILPTIFDLFSQAPRSLARSEGGLGIGLTLVKVLLELHEGTIHVSSEVGVGSVFVVRLPVAAAPGVSLHEVRPTPPAKISSRRILVVDDNLDTAQMLGTLLEFSGHAVELAHDGLSALEAVRRLAPDVVLLDIGLPGLNGYEVARKIREYDLLSQPLIIAVSGYGQSQDRDHSHAAGMDAHLVKPVDQEQLTAMLTTTSH